MATCPLLHYFLPGNGQAVTVNWPASCLVRLPSASSMHHPHPNDRSVCPLCQGPNACAMAAGLPPQACWCMSVTLSDQALAAVSSSEIGARCICKRCGADTRPAGAGSGTDQPPI
ncbi:cysteine-rich CWC family protein [Acidovorax sp.]|uniref:cysteine-rich CWC family protein n=1 Tax=Acidovorax sp. TaxID=1872122 RepID=UPI00343D3D8D